MYSSNIDGGDQEMRQGSPVDGVVEHWSCSHFHLRRRRRLQGWSCKATMCRMEAMIRISGSQFSGGSKCVQHRNIHFIMEFGVITDFCLVQSFSSFSVLDFCVLYLSEDKTGV
ncbi:hypothetical protein Cni_G06447 [Canna indica]|uniref:Uncharacterized protein n=1 Tax=Canna indica TaxID=4628 RepID=A0AAQ3JYQ4_9LILI|nr:hypothetical protein Cni_G06447 [Canna indica]